MLGLENLTKEYDLPPAKGKPPQVVAADRVNLQIADREIYGFVGPNGAGKTTTLKMICGLLVPTSGTVEVNGIDVERRPEDAHHSPYAAIFLPTPLFVVNSTLWNVHKSVWLLALALQILAGIVFIFLQRRRLAELRPHSPAPISAASAAQVR